MDFQTVSERKKEKKRKKKKEKGGRGRRRKKIVFISRILLEFSPGSTSRELSFLRLQLLDWMSSHELISNHCHYHITKLHFSVFFSFRRHCEVVDCDCFSWIDKKIIIFARGKG